MQMSYVQNFGPLDDEEPGAGVRVATRKPTFVNNNVSLFKINDNQRSPRPGPRVSVCQNRLIDKRTRGLAPTTTVAASSTHGTQKLEIGCFFFGQEGISCAACTSPFYSFTNFFRLGRARRAE